MTDCENCAGAGRITCPDCEGRGAMAKPLKYDHFIVRTIDHFKYLLKAPGITQEKAPIAYALNQALNDIIDKFGLSTQHDFAVHPDFQGESDE